MASELNLPLGQTGKTVTANVYLLGVAKATGIACAEIGTTGMYAGDFSASPNAAGTYQVAFFVDGATTTAGGGQIVWNGSAEVIQTGDSFARIGANGAGLTATTIAGTTQTLDALQTAQNSAHGAGSWATATGFSTIDEAGVRTAVGLGSANLDTQLGDLPTNAELATALGTADDAVLAAVAALNNLSAAGVRTAIGLASANLDTQLGAINSKTTNLPASPASTTTVMDANVVKVNDIDVTGEGTEADPWGPTP